MHVAAATATTTTATVAATTTAGCRCALGATAAAAATAAAPGVPVRPHAVVARHHAGGGQVITVPATLQDGSELARDGGFPVSTRQLRRDLAVLLQVAHVHATTTTTTTITAATTATAATTTPHSSVCSPSIGGTASGRCGSWRGVREAGAGVGRLCAHCRHRDAECRIGN